MGDLSVHEAIFTTRSMRHLKPDPVAREDLEYIIEAATMAPSAGNTQMWAFVVVTDPEQIAKIGAAYRDVGERYIRDGVLADPDITADRQRVYSKAMHNVEHLDESPAIIVPCLHGRAPDNSDISSGFFSSTYPAVQNILLAARSRGLGTVLLTLATDYTPVRPEATAEVRDVLGLPEDVTITALIPVGYPKGPWGRPWRKPWQDCTHWDRWGG
ncbi:MAG: nitroreductase family protein [Chloroflexota bacterium]|nr:nitroreductase family protein [Chloroflexota bacterium]MDE2934448.1 nitroreductase family protein [Chloroflexota bacterium]